MIQINTTLPFEGFFESKIGGRKENQDFCNYSETPYGLLLVVCDGMGGGPGGRTASTLAVASIIEFVKTAPKEGDPKEILEKAIKFANKRLRETVLEYPALRGMGTTTVALLISKESATIAHVGDSRVYQLRNKKKKLRTQDHSQVAELVRNGTLTEEQARLSSFSNIITRAIGTNDDCVPDVMEVPYEKGDRFVLCSDGVWGIFEEKNLIKLLTDAPSIPGTVDRISIKVDELGYASGGGHDNHTILMIETKTNSKLKEKMSTRTKYLFYAILAVCAISLVCNIIQYAINKQQDASNDVEYVNKLKDENEKLNQSIDSLKLKIETISNESMISKDNLKKEINTYLKEQAAKKEEINGENKQNTTQKSEQKPGNLEKDKNTTLLKEIDEIINIVKSWKGVTKNTKEKNDRVKQRGEIITKLKKMDLPKSAQSYRKQCIDLINIDLMVNMKSELQNPDSFGGQKNAIIKELNNIKTNI